MPAPHDAPAISSSPARLASLPILILNAHSRCNCRCVMCDIWKRETNEQIRAQDLERHRNSLKSLGVRQVVLTGGEPLLHSDLSALCNFFRDRQVQLTLLTTGLLLHKRADEVATLFDDVILSLDGPQEIHNSYPPRERCLRSNPQRRRRSPSLTTPSLPITCRTTVQKANHQCHLRQTVDAAKGTWSGLHLVPGG